LKDEGRLKEKKQTRKEGVSDEESLKERKEKR